MQTVLISGGTGLVGKALTKLLTAKGYCVIILSRQLPPNIEQLHGNISYAKWDVKRQQMDIEALQKADYIIHLAGAGVMEKKWTEEYKKRNCKQQNRKCKADSGKLKTKPQ